MSSTRGPEMIRGHWFRADYADEPCALLGCGRPQAEHVESVGEWMDPRHWFRPRLRQPSRCAPCGRLFSHSTHHGSRKNRQMWRRRRPSLRNLATRVTKAVKS